MSFQIFFPVPPTQDSRHAIGQINARAELFQLPMLNLNDKHRSIAMAKIAGQEVAYCIYAIKKGRIMIERIVVHPNHRRQGIATTMVNDIAHRFSPCVVQITLDAKNLDANDWARAVGFGATKFIRNCSGDSVQLEFMELDSKSDECF